MVRYLLHRLGRTLAVLLGVTITLFLALEAQPGPPELAVCGEVGCPPAVADELADTFDFGSPVVERAVAFGRAAVRVDFGPSLTQHRSSGSILAVNLGPSSILVAITLVLEMVFLGAVAGASAVGDRRWLQTTSAAFSISALVVPLFWFGMVVRAIAGPGLVAPAVVLAFGGIGFGIRQVHERVREGLDAAHVRLARSYGVPERRIVVRHGLRPAIPRALESLAGSGGVVLAGLLFLEPVFGRGGVGATIAAAIARQDRPVVLAGAYVLLVSFVLLRTLLLIAARLAEPPRLDRWSVT